jgi:hypothetical protein
MKSHHLLVRAMIFTTAIAAASDTFAGVADPGNFLYTPTTTNAYTYHSYLVGFQPSTNGIMLDSTFANLIANNLDPGGIAKIKDADFLFQECFGGGMISGLPNALGNIPWAAGSASTYWQTALATPAPAFGVQPQYASWSFPLVPTLFNNPNGTLINAAKTAYNNDFFGPNGIYRETPQYASFNAGNANTLADPGAAKHYAVIFVGDTSSLNQSMINVTYDMLTTLTTAWANQPYSINVLFGSGTNATTNITTFAGKNLAAGLANFNANNKNPAESITLGAGTPAALTNTLNNLNTTANDQFLFFGFDHGGKTLLRTPQKKAGGAVAGAVPAITTPTAVWTDTFTIDSENPADPEPNPIGELVDDGENEDPTAPPTLTITYSGLDTAATGNVEVLLNNIDLGHLDPTTTSTTFPLALADLQQNNNLEIDDNSGENVTILSDMFDSGALPPEDDTVEAPEPASLALLSISAMLLMRPKQKS